MNGPVPGSASDISLARDGGITRALPDDEAIFGDKGYASLGQCFAPYKRNQRLTSEERAFNKGLSSQRCIVENVFARIKFFAIMRDVFRGAHDDHSDYFRIICALVNFSLEDIPL